MRYRLLLLVLLLSGFLSGVDGQWLSGYGYRKSITIPAGQVIGGTQTNFPVLVSVTDNDLKTNPHTLGIISKAWAALLFFYTRVERFPSSPFGLPASGASPFGLRPHKTTPQDAGQAGFAVAG